MEQRRAPSRRVNELDTRGSHFYLALYWAQGLAKQTGDPELQAKFSGIAKQLAENEDLITQELIECQGQPVDIGGLLHSQRRDGLRAMRPSATLNAIVDSI